VEVTVRNNILATRLLMALKMFGVKAAIEREALEHPEEAEVEAEDMARASITRPNREHFLLKQPLQKQISEDPLVAASVLA
jgi:hypothetical protein